MKILTLFFALFLTILPENVQFINYSSWGQDVILEVVDDVEEEAVIRTNQTPQKQFRTSQDTGSEGLRSGLFQIAKYNFSVHSCFERQWLRSCALRL